MLYLQANNLLPPLSEREIEGGEKMKSKMLVSFLLVLLAFSITGASYAAWTSSVTINATATAGDIDLQINAIYGFEGSTAVTFSKAIDGDGKTATITVGNLYPGAEFNFTLRTLNAGSLPLKYDTFQLTTNRGTYDNYFDIGFLVPDGSSYNVLNDFDYFNVPKDYLTNLGVADEYVTSAAGAIHDNKITVFVDPTLPDNFMGETIEITVVLTADLAV